MIILASTKSCVPVLKVDQFIVICTSLYLVILFQDPMDYEQNDTQNDSRNDGQLSFYLEGKQMDRDLTLYQAIIHHQKAKYDTITHESLWNQIHKVTYKKASNSEKKIPVKKPTSHDPLLSHVLFNEIGSAVEMSTPCHNILYLLKISEAVNRFRFNIMSKEKIRAYSEFRINDLDDVKATGGGTFRHEFVNSRLTEKLEQQMRDPLAISAGGMPSWCTQLMLYSPFLFSFETRCKYFKLAALGKYQVQLNSGKKKDVPTPRKKFLVYRDQILESAAKMMDLNQKQNVVLEVKYDEEVGTGLGPTLEFFTLVSNEFQKPGLRMWRGDNLSVDSIKKFGNVDSVIVESPFGLFPCPFFPSVSVSSGVEFSEVKRKFVLLGQVLAKALFDGRVLDFPFSKAFYKLLLGQVRF